MAAPVALKEVNVVTCMVSFTCLTILQTGAKVAVYVVYCGA
jgi:hypothetical protein